MTSQTIANFDMAEDIRRKVRGDFIFRLIFTLIELFYIGADAECRRNKAPHKTLMIHTKKYHNLPLVPLFRFLLTEQNMYVYRTWVVKFINCLMWDVITYPCRNINGGLANLC